MAGLVSSADFSVLLLDGYNILAAKVQSFPWKRGIPQEKSDGLGDSWDEFAPTGRSVGTVTQAGAFFSTAASGIHTAMKDNAGVSRLMTFAPQGNTIGNIFVGFQGLTQVEYGVISALGKLTKADAAYQVSGRIDEGVILQTHVQQTIDWTNAGVDNAASSAFGGAAYLSVSQFAGLTGFVGYIEDSADGSTGWAVIGTFANVTAAPAAQRITIAGTIRRWTRFRGDVTGSGTITPYVGLTRFTA